MQTGDFGYLGFKDAADAAMEAKRRGAAGASGMMVSGGGGLSVAPQGNSSSVGGTNFSMSPVTLPPPPKGPGLKNLRGQLETVQRQDAINAAMKEYDDLEASTRSMGFQAAGNAGATYSARLMQAGINPVASGMVTAQAQLPVYQQLAQIGTEKEKTRLDATNRADALASQIASQIAQLQLGYANTLAQYNASMAGYNVDMSKFNASQALSAEELAQRERLAKLAAGGSSGGMPAIGTPAPVSSPFPGYITNSGPIIPGYGFPSANGHNVLMGAMAGVPAGF